MLIEHNVAGYTARIAVECRDRSRAATVQWIDELIGKYQNTGVKVVAVSKRGFAKKAKLKAEKAGIEPIVATDAVARDWSEWIESMPTIVVEMDRLDLISVDLVLGEELRNEDLPAARADSRLRLAEATEWTTPLNLYELITRSREFGEASISKIADSDEAQITIRLPASAQLELPNGRLIHPRGIRYHWRVTQERADIALKPLRVGNLDIAVGAASGTGWKAHLVWSYAADGSPRSTLSFSPDSSFGPGGIFITGSNPVPPFRTTDAQSPQPTAPAKRRARRKAAE